MGHKRSEIKKSIYDLLYENTTVGQNVFVQRYISFQDNIEFPAISIFCDSEEVKEVVQPQGYIRNLDLNIVIYTRTCEDEEDLSDKISNEIEAQIAKFKSKEFECIYSKMKYEGSGDSVHSNATTVLTFNIEYDSFDNEEDELDNFDEISIKNEVKDGFI
jgi:hypothetical protein